MKRFTWMLLTALLLAPLARSQEPALNVNAGLVGASGPLRTAPSIALSMRLPLRSSGFSAQAGASGWTLGSSGLAPAATELALSAGVAWRTPLSKQLGFLMAAGPAGLVTDQFGAPATVRPALFLAPSFELATRRRTVSLEVGVRGLVLSDAARFALGAGVTYAFH